MNLTVIGGSGLIGKQLTSLLESAGHRVTSASPSQGVDTLTGQGVAEALAGADVVVDVSNSPSFEAQAVMQFFRTSTTNLLAAEEAAGVRHHVALSVVGADRLVGNGYMRAKVALHDTRRVVADAKVPYFGSRLDDDSLVTAAGADVGDIPLDAWLANAAPDMS